MIDFIKRIIKKLFLEIPRFLRITYVGTKFGINLLIFIMLVSYFQFSLFIFFMGLFWLCYSFADIYEEERRFEHLENMMGKKK